MAGGSAGFHESDETLSPATKDMHRGIVSLMEELEAIDWYQQRIDAAADGDLKEILRHNRDEEKEHAAMLLEWIRRRDPSFDGFLRAFLFTDRPITTLEATTAPPAEGGNGRPGGGGASRPFATVGSLRGAR
jgi:ferritin-like protein